MDALCVAIVAQGLNLLHFFSQQCYRARGAAFGIVADGDKRFLPGTCDAHDGARQDAARMRIGAANGVKRLVLVLCAGIAKRAKDGVEVPAAYQWRGP